MCSGPCQSIWHPGANRWRRSFRKRRKWSGPRNIPTCSHCLTQRRQDRKGGRQGRGSNHCLTQRRKDAKGQRKIGPQGANAGWYFRSEWWVSRSVIDQADAWYKLSRGRLWSDQRPWDSKKSQIRSVAISFFVGLPTRMFGIRLTPPGQ